MQERFYASGSCVQKNCAILGVHPSYLPPTWVRKRTYAAVSGNPCDPARPKVIAGVGGACRLEVEYEGRRLSNFLGCATHSILCKSTRNSSWRSGPRNSL